jgi:hypothetical protein
MLINLKHHFQVFLLITFQKYIFQFHFNILNKTLLDLILWHLKVHEWFISLNFKYLKY